MFDIIYEAIRQINTHIFFLSVLLFFIGYAFAPTAYYKNIRWLTAYPMFVVKITDQFLKKHHHPLKILIIVISLNTVSLLLNLLSGWGLILPYLFIIYMGINIGVVMYHTLEGEYYYLGLINPVAMIELPAAWLSISMAIQFNLTNFWGNTALPQIEFLRYLYYFLVLVMPMLFLAGVLETILIKLSEKNKTGQD